MKALVTKIVLGVLAIVLGVVLVQWAIHRDDVVTPAPVVALRDSLRATRVDFSARDAARADTLRVLRGTLLRAKRDAGRSRSLADREGAAADSLRAHLAGAQTAADSLRDALVGFDTALREARLLRGSYTAESTALATAERQVAVLAQDTTEAKRRLDAVERLNAGLSVALAHASVPCRVLWVACPSRKAVAVAAAIVTVVVVKSKPKLRIPL